MHRVTQPSHASSQHPPSPVRGEAVRSDAGRASWVRSVLRALLPVALAATVNACGDDPTRPNAPRPDDLRPAFSAGSASGFTQVSAGSDHNCVLRPDGALACWGANFYGQATPPQGTFVEVDAGTGYTCARKSDGAIVCWGNNSYGQTESPAGAFIQVSAGFIHACALRADGSVACWGSRGMEFGSTTPPAGPFLQVSAADHRTCAVKTDRSIACWGSRLINEPAPPTGTFTQVSAGQNYACALATDGAITCWGWNAQGQVAGTPSTDPYFATFTHRGPFTKVSAGSGHACALKADGSVACWGATTASDGRATPPAGTFADVSAGGMHSCAIKADGALGCWGYNYDGQGSVPADLAPDHTPPRIATPADIIVDATSPAGAVVTYSVDVTDNVRVASQSCAPESGALFPVGTTTVRCSAADAAGNATAASFAVTVNGAAQQMDDLGETVDGLDLQQGTETSLKQKLDAALAALAAGNTAAACGQLDAMVKQVEASVPTKISRADADELITDINRIRATAGC